ncbi:tyrosine-type recombinase/integrase [Methanomethylovorans sp.]|uniref:tyrosine-type recombinase/integrase n=1 Tax=Methanomethylovorans sp. TaxID=2758717 RepID=UPI00345E4556
MTRSVDDVHSFDTGFLMAMKRLRASEISKENKRLIENFIVKCQIEGLAKGTLVGYLNYITRMTQRLQELGIDKPLDTLTEDDFNLLLVTLQNEKGIEQAGLRNYKKVTKKFFNVITSDEPPKWVRKLQLKTIDTPVQPSDLLTQKEFDSLMEACRHPRDKALIAVLADSGIRIGALASCRIKNVEFNQYGATVYLSKTGQANKTTPAKGIPLTWSTGHINQWLAIHPFRDDPEAPLWITMAMDGTPMSYQSLLRTVKSLGQRAGIKKRVHPHGFRHMAITHWILDGYNEQEIKHRAGWSKGSTRMFKIYGNFTDQEINDRIYEKCGLKTEDKRHVTLKKCPRCNNVLRPSDKFCSQCSLVLDRQALDEIKQYEDKLPELLQLVLRSEKARELLSNMGKS